MSDSISTAPSYSVTATADKDATSFKLHQFAQQLSFPHLTQESLTPKLQVFPSALHWKTSPLVQAELTAEFPQKSPGPLMHLHLEATHARFWTTGLGAGSAAIAAAMREAMVRA